MLFSSIRNQLTSDRKLARHLILGKIILIKKGLKMKKITASDYTGSQAWDALDIEKIENATVRLHWTNAPYKWHVNDGPEVFVVLDGKVDMHVRKDGVEETLKLTVGDIFHAENGDEHVAHPDGVVRALVIETAGSI